jgi:poly-gamma-glutamate capsule biosynthesis protein CapA/YwtB (metallophosphatase superfamily)
MKEGAVMDANATKSIKIFLCGDVMTGRGIDQVLPHPGDPTLYESYVRDARGYVQLAEEASGRIRQPVSFKYIWGDALKELERARVDLRIINLETSITRSDDVWPNKAVCYRMNPGNIGCLTAARVDACCLANNHVLDWGYLGLADTIRTLDAAGIAHAGAGENAAEAEAPAVLEVKGKGRVLLFSFGSLTSGVPWEWGATNKRPGVNLLSDLSEWSAARVAERMRQFQQPGDVTIASIHWGGNWGYGISHEQRAFAHRLIEEGVGIVHGHSSHHVKMTEVYHDHLIHYGCGDFLTDYEGISGYETFRPDLTFMYLAEVDCQNGELLAAQMIPMRVRQFQMHRASEEEARWLCELVNQEGEAAGTHAHLTEDNSIMLDLHLAAR